MKKFKKNVSGMTLVEVIVAMAFFATSTLGVCMAFSAALKYSARNMRRDKELTLQQTALEKNTTAGVMLNDGTTLDSMELVFKNGSNITTVTGLTEYKAIKTSNDGNDFNFEMKSLSSTPLGSLETTADKSAGKYRIYFINESSDTVDVTITVDSGYIYEGLYTGTTPTGYKHASPVYKRSLAAKDTDALNNPSTTEALPDRFLIGYFNSAIAGEASDVIHIEVKSGSSTYKYDVVNSSLNANGQVNLTMSTDGKLTKAYSAPT